MQFANIRWRHHQPYSLDFDDVYYSTDNGLEESQYVFIEHNRLAERFKQPGYTDFTIIETGFGAGLNFFCSARQFLDQAPENTRLQFISIEGYPLRADDFAKTNQHWPRFSPLAAELQAEYGQLKDGLNTFDLCDNRIQLTLLIGDISACLPAIQSPADAWFLDGFAPAKNSEMWSEHVFTHIARLSKLGTTFATFTSAGQVRRRLVAAGFNVNKVAGFGKKREMLCGILR